METTERLRNRIETAEELESVVRTMKGMAAVGIRQYERAVDSLTEYSRTIELGFQVLLRDRRESLLRVADVPGGPSASIVFGSDQGMCGSLNREIADHTLQHAKREGIEQRAGWFVAAFGMRVAAEFESVGVPVRQTFPLPSSVAGLSATVEDVLVNVQRWRVEEGVDQITLFHHRPLGGSTYEPQTVQLLPLDLDWLRSLASRDWPTRVLPTFTMAWEDLLDSLIGQQLFMALFRALAESLASENAARLAAMQAAEDNIEERIEELRMQFHQRRQAAITEELLDVVAGFGALEEKPSRAL